MVTVNPTGEACGAFVTDVDLTTPLDGTEVVSIRQAFADHHVLAFPDQPMTDDDLERFSLAIGEFGEDPYFAPIPGRSNIAEIRRSADESAPLFAESWHSDWSFLEQPPIATCLFGVTIPPVGGDTLFANQHLAYERLPNDLRDRIDTLVGVHTPRGIYGAGGMYDSAQDAEADRSMDIVQTDAPPPVWEHPLVRMHEDNGRPAIFSTIGYVQGVVGLGDAEAIDLLRELHQHQTDDAVIYRHQWQPNMLVMWDNRSVLHRATGGYDGYERVLHRTTIVARAAA